MKKITRLMAAAALLFAGDIAAAPRYTAIPIEKPAIPQMPCREDFAQLTYARRLNENLQLSNTIFCYVASDDPTRPWLFENGAFSWSPQLGSFYLEAAPKGTYGKDINESGTTLIMQTDFGAMKTAEWEQKPVPFSDPYLGTGFMIPRAINDNGTVLYTAWRSFHPPINVIHRKNALDTEVQGPTTFVDISNNETLVGNNEKWLPATGRTSNPGAWVRISENENSAGSISQYDDTGAKTSTQAQFWKNTGETVTLQNLHNFPIGTATSINNDQTLVGYSIPTTNPDATTYDYVATLWVNEVPYDLNSLVDNLDGFKLTIAADINNKGAILVRGFRESDGQKPAPILVYDENCAFSDCQVYDDTYRQYDEKSFLLFPTPEISAVVQGERSTDDWYVGNATVHWTINSFGFEIGKLQGCADTEVSFDSDTAVVTCKIIVLGREFSKSVTIKRDATSPVATATPSPLPNSAGWHNGSVRILFSGTDATSGVASCSTADLVATEGAAQTSAAGTCTDNAGNVSAPVTFSPINIDLTPPSVRGIPSPASNAAGWNNTPVTVSYAGEDTLSGVAADGCSAPQTLTASGAGQSATGTCADRAGNSASVTVSGINIDTVAPGAYASVSPAANAANWHKSPVTVSFTGTDSISGSGIAACSGNANVTADGGGQTRSGTCGDIAGNTSASAIATVNLDQTVPVVSITSPTSGGSYTQGSTLTAAFSCTDATSGINGCVGSVNSGQPISTATLGQMGFAAAATDFAGNSTLQTVYYTVTAPAPAFTLAPNSLAFGSQALNTATGLVVSIRNVGGTTLTLGTTSITGTHANQFTRTSACGTTLAAGGSCNFSITFKPTSAGNKVATFSVTTSTAGTKTVALSGTGVAVAFTVSPSSLTFPGQPRNTTSANKTVTVTNSVAVPINLSSITLSGENANQFIKTQTCGTILAANAGCTVSIAFKPTSTGTKKATLTVAPSGANSKSVAISGLGL